MRNGWRAAIVGAAVTIAANELPACRAHGQELRLGRPAAPELPEPNFATDGVQRLEEEIALLTSAAEGEESSLLRNLLLARANLRHIAQQLLQLGHESGPAGSVAILLGQTLFNGRAAIDQSLAIELWPADFSAEADDDGSFTARDHERFSDAYWSLLRFNETATARVELLTDPAADVLDLETFHLLLPLREALEALEPRFAVSHWVEREDNAVDGLTPPNGADGTEGPPLAERLASAPLAEETRAELVEINAILDAAAEFPEFQRQTMLYRRHIEDAIEYAEALAGAEWAPQALRDRALARLHAAVLLFKEKSSRAQGEAQLARLTDSKRTLERLTHLSSLARHRIRPTSLEQAFFNAEELLADPARAAGAREHLSRLRAVLERMIAWRETREPMLRRELKVACAYLDRMYEQAEKELLAALEAMPPDSQVGADPNLLALLANHAQILSDIEHVRSIPQWTEKIEDIRPAATERFEAQARRIAQWLVDPARRAEAVRSMNDLAAEIELFLPMPFEDELRSASAEAASMTGGQHLALQEEIDRQRENWIDAWAEGEGGGEPLARLLLLHRLMRAMGETVEISRLGGDAAWLNRWAAWEATTQAMAPAVSELPNRLRLASHAAVSGNVEDLQGQLDRIDSELPLAELIGRIAAIIGPALRALPEGGLATVEQIVSPPGSSNGWMMRRRIEIARICRYASEEAFARSEGRTEAAEACAEYVNSLAQDLLRDLEPPPR